MSETYRILASLLGESDLYVEATVDDVALDGTVTLSEAVHTDPRAWTTTLDQFDEWQATNRAATLAELDDPDNDIWTDLAAAYDARDDAAHADAAPSLGASIEDAFCTLVFQHTN